ncbi:ATP-dependent RNA helicase dhx8 [Chytridiales sp. JEL 0842]|nr:ATP-dependent RNA helicase dhx8 [Chytridiales sp. JEL 0842]
MDLDRYRADFNVTRSSLPIYKFKESIVDAIKEYQTLIVVGDTVSDKMIEGSGKTTQITQYLHEYDPNLRIAITQPRRIAAISAATRVAEEADTRLGTKVGYSIRFESMRSPDTKILYMTDGTLLRQAASSHKMQLDSFDVVVLDEAHERSLDTDVLFGLLKRACKQRPDLKLIVMSATLNMDKFSAFFDDAPIFTVPGRMYPVDLLYARKVKMAALKSTFVSKAVDAVMHIHKNEEPGQHEIETACRLMKEALDELPTTEVKYFKESRYLSIHPIYSALDTPDQRAVFSPAKEGHRKVVVATNIAQTSVTIPGIRYVVDSGFVKEKVFDPQTGVDALLVVPISKAAATQRAGRAGRTAPGKVFRLYSREAFEDMDEDTIPEIQRSSLLGTVLSLKAMGIDDILKFDFIDAPDPTQIVTALKQLYYLGIIDDNGKMTPLGQQISEFPIAPFLSRALIAACKDFNCGEELLTLAALLSSEDLFVSPRHESKKADAEASHGHFAHRSGDHVTILRIYAAWLASGMDPNWCRVRYLRYRALKSAKNIRDQLEEITRKLGLDIKSCRIRGSSKKQSHNGHHHKKDSRSHQHRNDHHHYDSHYADDTPLEDYDSTPILKSICAGFFVNTAKRHPQRPFFYHYLTSTSNSSDSNSSLLSLHASPSSVFADTTTSQSRSIQDLDWVVYHDVQFVNRANLRVISRIDFGWVEAGIKRVGECPLEEIVEAAGGTVEMIPGYVPKETGEKDGGKKRKREEGGGDGRGVEVGKGDGGNVDAGSAGNGEEERLAKIQAAKARYLARKK